MNRSETRYAAVLALALVLALLSGWQLAAGAAGAAAPAGDQVPTLPPTPYNYIDDLPPHFDAPTITNTDNTPEDNPITNEGATLGRVLFYDVKLSVNDTIACASCHQQANGFSDPNQFSVGFNGGLTARHSMSLANNRFYLNGAFFWDERAATLEQQTLMPIQDPVEMGMDLAQLEIKLAATSYYPDLFNAAFGTPDITSERISLALAQFMRAMVSYRSKYDVGVGIDFANFTPQENAGRLLFRDNTRGRCIVCHRTDIQILNRPRNTGLDATTTDPGVGGVTGEPADEARFKAPSLRNIALTAPYMHDGRFNTLDEVIDFYDHGVQPHPNLDPALIGPNGLPRQIELTPAEHDALRAFLLTLTDIPLATDVRFSNPFLPPQLPALYLPIVFNAYSE